MIQIIYKIINDSKSLILIQKNNENIKFNLFLKLLKNKLFIDKFKEVLLKPSYDYYYETSSITSFDDTFIILLVKTIFNNNKIDYKTYAEYFKECNKSVKKQILSFDSLSKTTKLIIPCNVSNKFIHFKMFLINGSDNIIYQFFKVLSYQAKQYLIKHKILYMKTHGKSINYFHFRLQNNNTYYEIHNFNIYL